MLIISHRGYHVELPENTLAAFEAAIAVGVDGIETDLRLTKDGQLVLFHNHVTPDGRNLADITHQQLCQATGRAVPTAESVLERFPDVLWNLEIKVPAATADTLRLLQRFQATHKLLVTSFWHNVVDAIALQTDIECGLLVAHRPRQLPLQNPRVRTIVWYYETMDPAMLVAARQAGWRNFAYGLATPAEHWQAAALGLDAIITDRPEWARRKQPPVAGLK